ncbi:MAG: ABC transporter permease subunit [Candidatus Electrothrix sp. AUS4]|nr:ABC transporter permease subunit [Candidatus Electrothrix sp. AUS4]
MRRLNHVLKLAGFLGFLSIPHLANKFGANQELFLTWDKTINEFLSNPKHYLLSLLYTLSVGAIAVFMSTIIGVASGILFAYFERWLGFMETVMKFIWSVPLIVVAVYLNIFIDNSVLFVIITGVFLGIFPIISYTYNKAIEPNDGILSIVATFNMSKKAEFFYLRLREIFKNFSVALDQSIPLTYIGVTMGEYTVGGVAGTNNYGLGSDFQFGMNNTQYEVVYVSIIFMVFLVYASGEASRIPSIARSFIIKLCRRR